MIYVGFVIGAMKSYLHKNKMSRVQKVLYHEDTEMYEADNGIWYNTIEEVVRQNIEYFQDIDIEYLIQNWSIKPPKRINFISPIEWIYEV